MTLEAFELIELLTSVLGGRGCGLSITFELVGLLSLDEGLPNLELGTGLGCEFFPETIMIDLCPDDVDCATSISAGLLGLLSEDGCWPWLSAKAKFVVRRIATETKNPNVMIFMQILLDAKISRRFDKNDQKTLNLRNIWQCLD
jgi:hypothetical protein